MYAQHPRETGPKGLLEGLGSCGTSGSENRALQVEVRRGPQGTVESVA